MIWIRRGSEIRRWDGIRLFGRPPVLAPPAWALAERVWDAIGIGEAAPERAHPEITPTDWRERLLDGMPEVARSIVLVVPDATRVGAWRQILPSLLCALRGRYPTVDATLLVASGVHAVVDERALLAHLFPFGDFAALEGWTVLQNGGEGFRTHVALGETEAGTPLALHPRYVGTDLRILAGDVSYHYFAGIGGGPKLVFPGLATPEGARINHERALRVERIGDEQAWLTLEERAAPSQLDGNPVFEDLCAAVRLAPPHGLVVPMPEPPFDPDPAEPVAWPLSIVQGEWEAAHREAAVRFDAARRIEFTARPDLLIVDAGGSPRDATFLQAHKALQHAARFVNAGARVLVAAACAEGMGSSFLAWRAWAHERERRREAGEPLSEAGDSAWPRAATSGMHEHTALALEAAITGLEVGLWSDLPSNLVRGLGLIPVRSEADAIAFCQSAGPEPRWGFLPGAERFLPAAGWRGGAPGTAPEL